MIKVFNPIYDTVFKYLVEDEKVARILLSNILNKKVKDVKIKSNDHVLPVSKNLKLLRIDFGATIINDNGKKEIVTIELQKASEEEEVMRFRKYMGLQIQNEANAEKIKKTHRNGDEYEILKPLPIYCIYILGHGLGKGLEYPLLKNKITYVDQFGNEIRITNNDFINAMSINVAIVQIPHLPEKPKTHLEKILSIFDQRNIDKDKQIYVNINENTTYGNDYKTLLNRLLKGTVDENLRGDLDFEQEMIRKFERDKIEKDDLKFQLIETQNQLSEKQNQLSETQNQLSEKENQLSETQNQLSEKQNQLSETQNQLSEKENQLSETQNQLSEKENQLIAMVKMSATMGIAPEQIAKTLNISITEVNNLTFACAITT